MDSLVAAVIHDAKNALNALNVHIDQARQQTPSADLDQATAIAARISSQLVELLALYRADQGTLKLSVEDHDLGDFLADLSAELTPPPSSASISLALDTAGALAGGTWAFDAYLVKVALLDALRNSLRHARSSVSLSVTLVPGDGLHFTITDDGPGYPQEVLAGGDAITPMAEGSSGLGLRFARLIADLHRTPQGRHGRLELSNQDGARLSLILP